MAGETNVFPLKVQFGVELTVDNAEDLEAITERGEELEAALKNLMDLSDSSGPPDDGDISARGNPPCWVEESESVVGYNVRGRTYNLGDRKKYCREQQPIYVKVWRDINNNKTRTQKYTGTWEEVYCTEWPIHGPWPPDVTGDS